MNAILLQSSSSQGIVLPLVVLAFSILLFFAIRGVFLWYWKVDIILKNQEETNRLLRGIARHLESRSDSTTRLDNET
ncbi:hypothetical protein [Parapedobacter pyrenivorans]|uniref:hypothetical protein n=1 Tax=Parapedobacter pyrenivorans TaxID=1305674 RepID=UPI001E4622C3|nr:hypothetical protein [Parapedobacter pyrenivorans]